MKMRLFTDFGALLVPHEETERREKDREMASGTPHYTHSFPVRRLIQAPHMVTVAYSINNVDTGLLQLFPFSQLTFSQKGTYNWTEILYVGAYYKSSGIIYRDHIFCVCNEEGEVVYEENFAHNKDYQEQIVC